MSDFSDFFPAAGGGGGIGQTITVGDISYPNARPLADFVKDRRLLYRTAEYNEWTFNPVNSLAEGAYSVTATTDDTFITVADITGAANGGAFYSFVGWKYQSSSSTSQLTVRITIDGGSPVTYSFAQISYASGANIIGNVNQVIVSRDGGLSAMNNIMLGTAGRAPQAWTINYNSATGYEKNYGSSFQSNGAFSTYTQDVCTNNGLPYVYFASSFKIEFKSDIVATLNTGTATIKTF